MNLFTDVQNDEMKLREGKTAAVGQQSTAIKMKMYVGEKSIDCSTDSTWKSGSPPPPPHTPLLPACISWLIGSLRQ